MEYTRSGSALSRKTKSSSSATTTPGESSALRSRLVNLVLSDNPRLSKLENKFGLSRTVDMSSFVNSRENSRMNSTMNLRDRRTPSSNMDRTLPVQRRTASRADKFRLAQTMCLPPDGQKTSSTLPSPPRAVLRRLDRPGRPLVAPAQSSDDSDSPGRTVVRICRRLLPDVPKSHISSHKRVVGLRTKLNVIRSKQEIEQTRNSPDISCPSFLVSRVEPEIHHRPILSHLSKSLLSLSAISSSPNTSILEGEVDLFDRKRHEAQSEIVRRTRLTPPRFDDMILESWMIPSSSISSFPKIIPEKPRLQKSHKSASFPQSMMDKFALRQASILERVSPNVSLTPSPEMFTIFSPTKRPEAYQDDGYLEELHVPLSSVRTDDMCRVDDSPLELLLLPASTCRFDHEQYNLVDSIGNADDKDIIDIARHDAPFLGDCLEDNMAVRCHSKAADNVDDVIVRCADKVEDNVDDVIVRGADKVADNIEDVIVRCDGEVEGNTDQVIVRCEGKVEKDIDEVVTFGDTDKTEIVCTNTITDVKAEFDSTDRITEEKFEMHNDDAKISFDEKSEEDIDCIMVSPCIPRIDEGDICVNIDTVTDWIINDLILSTLSDPRLFVVATCVAKPQLPVVRAVRVDAFDRVVPVEALVPLAVQVLGVMKMLFLPVIMSLDDELSESQIEDLRALAATSLADALKAALSIAFSLCVCISDAFSDLLDSLPPAQLADREWMVKYGAASNPISSFLPRRHSLNSLFERMNKILQPAANTDKICSDFVTKFRSDESLFQLGQVFSTVSESAIMDELNAFIIDAIVASVANDFSLPILTN